MRKVMVELIGFGYSFTFEHKGIIVPAECCGVDVQTPKGLGSTHYKVHYKDLIAAGMTDAYAIGGEEMLPFIGERHDDFYNIQDFTYYCEVGEYNGSKGGRNVLSKAKRKQARWDKRKAIKRARRSDWVPIPFDDDIPW